MKVRTIKQKMYNYKRFRNKEYDLIHSIGIKVGDKIPNFTVLNLDGTLKNFTDYLDSPVVLETGSITCGMFAGQSNKMNELSKTNVNFNFLLLYVREAHPGKIINAHNSINEKCELANRLHHEDKIENRKIIIDDINGTVHNALGALPNMVFMIDINGIVIFKENWNNAKALEIAIKKYNSTKQPFQQKWSMLPFPNIPVEYRVFKRAGWDAGFDFILALPKLILYHVLGGLCNKFIKLC